MSLLTAWYCARWQLGRCLLWTNLNTRILRTVKYHGRLNHGQLNTLATQSAIRCSVYRAWKPMQDIR